MKVSEITFMEALDKIEPFNPVKILFNNIELYNDFDSNRISIDENGNEIIGEDEDFLIVVPERLWQCEHYRITSIKIEIVEFHHSIVTMEGYFERKENKDEQ